jgi:hypothetical protein
MPSHGTDVWPNYLPAQRDELIALGVIALNYGQLESMFQHVFAEVTRLNEIQVAAIFQRIPNNVRQDILFQTMAQTTLPDPLKELVQHFGLGFKACAANRHAVMHSRSGGVFTSQGRGIRGILLTKYSKAGNKLVCPAGLTELREVADGMHIFMTFGSRITGDIRNFIVCRLNGREEEFWRIPLPDKPPLPTEMKWRPESEILVAPAQSETPQT